ncbi:MAG: hypothetical protein ACRCX2_24665 [Paraclostridium sp.]
MTKKQTIKKKGGRPETTLTDEQITEIEKIAEYLTIEQIADYFGIGSSTFYRIKQKDPRVSVAYKKGKTVGIKHVASKLRALIDQGDVTATIFYLKTQAGWSTDHKNDNKIKLKFPDNKTPSDILDTALSVLENGDITLNDAQRIADLAMVKLNITSKTDIMQQAVMEKESEERLLDKMYTIRKVLEHEEKKNKVN